MSNQLLFVGLAGGLAVAIGLALLFSAISTQSTAQMMHNQGTMGQGMMATQSTSTPWQWNQRSMFNANGMSTADNVQITGVSVTGDDEVTVNLRYDGSETSPAVTVIAITNPMAMHGSMGMSSGMMGMGGMGMMQGGQSGMMMNGTSTAWPGQFAASQSQTGSSVLEAGWTSSSAVTVKLEGDGLAYDGTGVHVMVFPLTS
jgi:hypothetical protein